MGEWNETCLMTRLPILPGEAVMGLLLARRDAVLDRSYPDGEYMPIGLPVLGEYDGYGGLEDPWATKGIVSTAGRFELYEQTGGDYQPFQPDSDMAYCVSHLFSAAADDRLFVNTNTRGCLTYKPVEVVFVKHDFYRFAIQQYIADFGPYCLQDDVILRDRLPEAMRPDPDQPACDNLRRYLAFRACMNACRIPIAPVCGKGSQAGISRKLQLKLYKLMYDAARDICD